MRQHDTEAFAWEAAQTSARVIVPLVLEYVQPRSVVDVGCGVGAWLSVFKEHGVEDIYGIDNDWVGRERLLIPPDRFTPQNLEEPIVFNKKCDLAVCLETAEHLDARHADRLIQNLTSFAPVILFSAAIPFQGGVHHVNEQWPEYWAEKFAQRGFVPVDCLRRKVWSDSSISFWYKQNILIFIDASKLSQYPELQKEVQTGNDRALSLVHPDKYLYFANRWNSVIPILGLFPAWLLRMGKKVLQYPAKS